MHVRSPRPPVEPSSRPSGPELSADPRNSDARGADLSSPDLTPPEGGWSAWYLTDEDDVGESTEQGITVRLLLAALTELARERGWARSLVAGDQFFAWVESHPFVRISPDVYVLDDPPPAPYPGMWQTWLPGHPPPRFAVEVASDDWKKDYDDAPRKYHQLGARELVIFDPGAPAGKRRGRRVPLQLFRRGKDGAFTRVAAGPGPVHSVELDAWLVVVPGPRLRIARDPAGTDLVATPEEQVALLRRENLELRRENTELRARVATLEESLETLEAKNSVLEAKNSALEAKNSALEAKNSTLEAKITALEAKNSALEARNTALEARNTALEARNAALEAKVAGLEDKLTRVLERLG